MAVDLSIVIPVFNARSAADSAVRRLAAHLDGLAARHEIIVVDDGSRAAESVVEASLPPPARLVRLAANRGKGHAVRTGMLVATGRCRLFTDVDLPYDLSAIDRAYHLIASGAADFVPGDRRHRSSRGDELARTHRQALSRLFSWTTRTLLLPDVRDSQCGFKAFSGDLADEVFARTVISRFAFDLEVFVLAAKARARTQRIPVTVLHRETSSVRPLRDGPIMMRDLFRIVARHGARHRLVLVPDGDELQ